MTDIPEPVADESSAPDEQRGADTGVAQDSAQTPPQRHVDTRTIVIPDLRILYVPVPKAGCTAILWSLAQLAGLEEDRFYRSYYREVSRSLTIHDYSGWPDEFLYASLDEEEKDRILAADDWLRFTVVRHPFRRLWSAWQSKLLLNEPQFIEKFSAESWFPRSVGSADEVLAMFRQFLQALEEDPDLVSADVHWAPQVDLTSCNRIPYTHIGRVEKLGETMEIVREHVQGIAEQTLSELGRANATPIPYVDELFRESDVEILAKVFADDLREFDYDPPDGAALDASCPPSWVQAVEATAPALQALRQRNERVGDLQQLFKGKREELQGRVGHLQKRVEQQKTRIGQLKERVEEQQRRNNHQAKLRRQDLRRIERIQKRLDETTRELTRIKQSASWRYTAKLRRLRAAMKPRRER